MPEWLKDLASMAAMLTAVVGGLIAAFKAITELREKRIDQARALRWTQAKEAQRILEAGLGKREVRDALTMLDWSREFTLPDGSVETISQSSARDALRTINTAFTPSETYVRDCFDSLFGFLDQLEHAVTIELVSFSSVAIPVEYYVDKMARRREVFEKYLDAYGYRQAKSFLLRFPSWTIPMHESMRSVQEVPHDEGEAERATAR